MVLLLIALYFLIRLPNLTLLPIFTDETNYLDWGWRAIHAPGHLWYSLYDAKPPLVMWLFGIFESFIRNPLLAGRLVSVLFGLITLLGLYFLGKKYFSRPVALLTPVFYILSPIFHLYDRQALMESALAAVFVWLIYVENPILSGLLLGLGLLIKPTALLFLAPFLLLRGLSLLKSKNFGLSFLRSLTSIFIAFLVTLPMLIQPIWQKTSSLTGQYLQFPSPAIFTNFTAVGDIIFWHLTPLVTLLVLIGLIKFRRSHWPIIVWVFLPLALQVITGKFLIHRYLAPFLPPLLLFAAAVTPKRLLLLLLTITIPSLLVLLQTFNPPAYFQLMSRFTKYSYIGGYITTEAAGYNVINGLAYFSNLSKTQSFTLGLGLYSGNPEAAFLVYFRDHPKITVSYMDASLFTQDLTPYKCLSYPQPLYLATRDSQAAGLSRFMETVTVITNSYGDSRIYVFRPISNCVGKSLDLNLTIKP